MYMSMRLGTICIDTVNITTVVVLCYIFVYDLSFSYKTLAHQCLKNKVKSPSIVWRPLHPRRRGLGV